MKEENLYEFDSAEVALLVEAVKKQIEKVEHDRFYRAEHPRAFYDIYLERYWEIIKKLDKKIPKKIYKDMPKFF